MSLSSPDQTPSSLGCPLRKGFLPRWARGFVSRAGAERTDPLGNRLWAQLSGLTFSWKVRLGKEAQGGGGFLEGQYPGSSYFKTKERNPRMVRG